MAGGCLCFPPGLNHSVWEFYLQDDFDRDFLSKGVKDGFRIIDEGAKHDLSHVKLTIISLAYNMQNKSRDKLCVRYRTIIMLLLVSNLLLLVHWELSQNQILKL